MSGEVSQTETQSQSSSTGTSTSKSSGGQWDSVGSTPINFNDTQGSWAISINQSKRKACPKPYCTEIVTTMYQHRKQCVDRPITAEEQSILKGCGQYYWTCPNSPDWITVEEDVVLLGLSKGDKIIIHEIVWVCLTKYHRYYVIPDYCGYYYIICTPGYCPHETGQQTDCSDCTDDVPHHHY